MNKFKNIYIRRLLRVGAGAALTTELVFSIIVPKIKGNPVYLDVNDGYIIGFSIALLISIEAVKKFVDSYINNKSNK